MTSERIEMVGGGLVKRNQHPVPPDEIVRKEHRLTRVAFSRLLEWLDDGVDSHGERYLEMRRRLVSYFDHDGAIATVPPAHYCYVVARFVLLEDVRREHMHVPVDEP
jgi:hypothetical protein